MLNVVVVRFPSAWPWRGFVRRLEEGALRQVRCQVRYISTGLIENRFWGNLGFSPVSDLG